MVTSSKLKPLSFCATRTRLIERLACSKCGSCEFSTALTQRSPSLPVNIQERHIQHLLVLGPLANHQGRISLASLAFAELILQGGQRTALLGDQQQTGRFLVQSVHQLQELGVGRA